MYIFDDSLFKRIFFIKKCLFSYGVQSRPDNFVKNKGLYRYYKEHPLSKLIKKAIVFDSNKCRGLIKV